MNLITPLALCALLASADQPHPPFAFQNHDRILFLGGAIFERELAHAYWEAALTSATPNLDLSFRHLSNSPETVWDASRSDLDSPPTDFQSLLHHIREQQPTVLFLAFGPKESFAGEAGLADFIQQYEQLLDVLAPLKCRLVFITPHQFESVAPPLPEVRSHNRVLGRYALAIRELAARRHGWLIDLFHRTAEKVVHPAGFLSQPATALDPPRGFRWVDGAWRSLPLTDNGQQLSPYGSLRTARMAIQQLKLTPAEFLVQLDATGALEAAKNATMADFHSDGTQARFHVTLSRLPEPPTPLFPRDVEYFFVAGGGLPSREYALKIDGEVAAHNPSVVVGFPVRQGPEYQHAETLRQKIIAKNQLCIEREQLPPSAERTRLDDLITLAEQEIAQLRHPIPRLYEIVPRTPPQ